MRLRLFLATLAVCIIGTLGAFATPASTATCGSSSCSGGGGAYVWGPCYGYPIGTIGMIGSQPVQCLMWGGTPTWIPF